MSLLTFNKSDIVRDLQDKGFARPEACVDRILSFISAALWAGESVSIRNFGKFETHVRPPRARRNPQTGAPVEVPEKTVVVFSAAPKLKDKVND